MGLARGPCPRPWDLALSQLTSRRAEVNGRLNIPRE